MQLARRPGYLTLRDRAAPFWGLGFLLLAGGVLAVAMSLGLASNAGDLGAWERLASIAIGLGVIAGALWWLARSPATKVELDLARRRIRVVRVGLRGRQVRELSFDELDGVEVEQSRDTDGGTVWRPVVRLRTGAVLLLSELWSHDQAGVQECVAAMAEACRLPLPARSGAIARGAV